MRDVREGINDNFKILGPQTERIELTSRLKPQKEKKNPNRPCGDGVISASASLPVISCKYGRKGAIYSHV